MAKEHAYRAGPISGLVLPAALPDRHQIRSGALESGPQPAGERAAYCHRNSVLLVYTQHQIEEVVQFFGSVVSNRSLIIKLRAATTP